VVHFDGTTWTDVSPPPGTNLQTLWGTAPGQIVAAGLFDDVWQRSNDTWTELSGAPSVAYHGVWATAPDDIFLIGDAIGAPTIVHYNGSQWTSYALGSSYSAAALNAIWGTSESDVYTVGTQASPTLLTALHFDGTTWSSMFGSGSQTIVAQGLNSVWSAGGVAYAAAQNQVIQYDSGTWTPMPAPSSTLLNGLSGSGPHDIFAVGSGGTIWHYVGLGL
jgi:hypothetical protein